MFTLYKVRRESIGSSCEVLDEWATGETLESVMMAKEVIQRLWGHNAPVPKDLTVLETRKFYVYYKDDGWILNMATITSTV